MDFLKSTTAFGICKCASHLFQTKRLTTPSWACAVPTVVFTILIISREAIYNWLVKLVQRRHILTLRKKKTRTKKQKAKLKV